jgi:ParB/RepB/Spo0J family partition protein
MPVIVVDSNDPGRYVLLDGYKRVRALERLGSDTVRSMRWEIPESDALLLERLMRRGTAESPLEQAWLLRELRYRFAMTVEELARRLDRSSSWVSRRLALVSALPEEIQDYVRKGRIVAHAAMKYLVPLARANREDSLKFVEAIAPHRLTTRQIGTLYAAHMSGTPQMREAILSNPMLFLRTDHEIRRVPVVDIPAVAFIEDLRALVGVARRAERKLRDGAIEKASPPHRDEIAVFLDQARVEMERLVKRAREDLDRA